MNLEDVLIILRGYTVYCGSLICVYTMILSISYSNADFQCLHSLVISYYYHCPCSFQFLQVHKTLTNRCKNGSRQKRISLIIVLFVQIFLIITLLIPLVLSLLSTSIFQMVITLFHALSYKFMYMYNKIFQKIQFSYCK